MKKLESEKIYDGKIIKVFRDKVLLDNGNSTHREVVRHGDGVAVVAIDNEDNVLLVKQHRYPIAKDMVELPAGLVDSGESPLICGIRELLEETGHGSEKWSYLTTFYSSPGSHDEKLHIFLAMDVYKKGEQSLDSDEILTYDKMPFQKAIQEVIEGLITDGKTIIGLLLAKEAMKDKTSLVYIDAELKE